MFEGAPSHISSLRRRPFLPISCRCIATSVSNRVGGNRLPQLALMVNNGDQAAGLRSCVAIEIPASALTYILAVPRRQSTWEEENG